jgi:hypothetical protein
MSTPTCAHGNMIGSCLDCAFGPIASRAERRRLDRKVQKEIKKMTKAARWKR